MDWDETPEQFSLRRKVQKLLSKSENAYLRRRNFWFLLSVQESEFEPFHMSEPGMYITQKKFKNMANCWYIFSIYHREFTIQQHWLAEFA